MERIEIITIGDELVEGRLVDTNAATLSERLFVEGFQVARHLSLADDRDEIVAALREAASRSRAVLVSGGLGPTSDDLTAACAAEAFGVPLARSEEALRHVQEFFSSRGRQMSPNNAKQADLPRGAEVLPNPWGTAVGFRVETNGCRLYFMPGVPRELEGIFGDSVLPELRDDLEASPPRVAVIKVFGTGESDVARMLDGLDQDLPEGVELIVQYRATFPEIHVRLLLSGVDDGIAEELLGRVANEARQRLGRHVYAFGDADEDSTFPGRVAEDIRRAGLSLAAAEGCTAGTVAQLMSSVPDVSEIFLGSVIAPTRAALIELLGVDADELGAHGELSPEIALAMAAGVRSRLGADLGVAVVGTPRDSTDGSAGTLVVAISSDAGDSHRSFEFPMEADRFQRLAAYVALGLVRRAASDQ
jgi:nicotinamide-nucleotide amidase